jgi:hypothetical protein
LHDLTFIFVENVREVFREALRERKLPVEKAKARAAKPSDNQI